MTPGTNYPVQDHSVWFWVAFLAAAVLMTVGLMCLFLWQVYRTSQVTLPEGVAPPRLPARPPATAPDAPAPEVSEVSETSKVSEAPPEVATATTTSAPELHESGTAPAA